jgi:hypothetical protein
MHWIFAQNIINCPNFLSYDIESAKTKVRLLELHIKIIHFLFYYFVINFSQNWPNILEQISYFICWSIINITVFILQLPCVWKKTWRRVIYIDYYMEFFISFPLLALGHDISPRADNLKERYMKEDR